MIPHADVTPNTWNFLWEPMIAPMGFREYDARWQYPDQINLPGITALGRGLGTQIRQHGLDPHIVVGHDYRDYSLSIKNALIIGLMDAGITVHDIGPALSPMAYFAREYLGIGPVAMVTASHNPNGWTGVKMGLKPPLTHGPEEMAELRAIVLEDGARPHAGGALMTHQGVREAYLDDLVGTFRLSRPLRVVCACGNGTAAAFAPDVLSRIGAEVIPLHADLDYTFPNYNPNPEAMEMLHDMARAVTEAGADLALGFDGDGDRCGVVTNEGEEIFADKMGVMLARDLITLYPGATFVADVKSTGLFASDPVLQDAKIEYWKTGHSHMKARVQALNALAGFEKSGHYFLNTPIGRGYDCGMRVAVEICKLLDRHPGKALSDLYADLPRTWSTPTLSPYCPDTEKYQVMDRLAQRVAAMAKLAGRKITQIVTVNGARIMLEGGGWGLIRASSNTPNLVVVCESPNSEREMREIFEALDALLKEEPSIGPYDQMI